VSNSNLFYAFTHFYSSYYQYLFLSYSQDSYKELTSKTVAMGRCLKVKTLTQHGYQAINLCQWLKVNDRYHLATHAPVFVEFHLVHTCSFD
jgi:hypothetical protein